jgi:ribonucleoside-diphosphate reductase alpha chain
MVDPSTAFEWVVRTQAQQRRKGPMNEAPHTTVSSETAPGQALQIRRLLTSPGTHPFESVEWELRDAHIGHGDHVAFEQRGVEFPKTWSQNATNIVAQKYFRGQLGSPARESSVKQMIGRVAGTITGWGRAGGYFASEEDATTFEHELTHILLHQMAAFNSPVWFNVGFEEHPQCSACFILSVEDTMESILGWNTKEGNIFRGGSGSGINLSKIRGSMEPLAKGGTASGPVSFMRGADSWAGTIKSGGKTRRAAKMVVLDVDHPDIREFIWCKAKEEDKAAALRDAGFDMSIDGDGFFSIQYQNANNSVRITDEFMKAVEEDGDWNLIARTTGEPVGEPIPARELMQEIAEAAWRCADPGVQYDTTINHWHTSPVSGRINASNPCSEYMHVDDSACNLASINLMKFRRADGTFDVESFEHTVDIVLLAQEIIVGPSSYPTEEIGVNARAFRQLGLGYANLGAYLMSNGMPYDSDEGRGTAAAITALMTGRAYRRSAEVAGALGPYERYAENREPHNAVMRMHRDASYAIPDEVAADGELLAAARRSWDQAVELGEQLGYRNAQATVLAPTGTISFLMDCDTTGVEPDFSLVKFKELVGGGQMTIVNRTVPSALQTLGYSEPQIEQIEAHLAEHGTIVGAPGLEEAHLAVFDVAVGERAISHMGHIKMMGAVQPFISGAISKTVNMPQESTVEDIADAYIQAWRQGVKALAIYRDGSKTAQALRTDAQEKVPANVDEIVEQAVAKALAEAGPRRKRMPRERQSLTHKFSIGGHEGYITAGMYEDGSVGEIFLTDIGKEGSTLRGMMNSFATSISIALQYGVPLETLVQKFSYMRFDPEGITGNPEIPFAKSMPDYIMRWLASRFLDADAQEELGILTPQVRARKAAQDALAYDGDTAGPAAAPESVPGTSGHAGSGANAPTSALTDSPPVVPARLQGLDLGPACSQCGGMMQRTGSCYTCSSCGNNTGCG